MVVWSNGREYSAGVVLGGTAYYGIPLCKRNWSSIGVVPAKTTPGPLRTIKYYSRTTLYYKCTTPIQLCTTRYYSVVRSTQYCSIQYHTIPHYYMKRHGQERATTLELCRPFNLKKKTWERSQIYYVRSDPKFTPDPSPPP